MTDPPHRPLWASSLAEQEPADDVVLHRVETSSDPEPDAPQDDRGRLQVPGRAVVVLLVALVAGIAVAALDHGGPFRAQDVASGWGSVPMRCDAARIEFDTRAVELFTCRAPGGGLPVGRYRTPAISWNSDIDRKEAVGTDVRITSGRELHGWASYVTGFG